MSRLAAHVPDESSMLCEQCGYTLDGLPPGANCPECGTPTDQSAAQDGRLPPAWESTDRPLAARWLATTARVIFRPSAFFRGMTTRGSIKPAYRFALLHWGLSAVLFGLAARAHWFTPSLGGDWVSAWAWVILSGLTFLVLWGITRIASSLTAWEARYRGIRLPRPVVLRGLYYHAAHMLPVAVVALATTAGYQLLDRRHLLKPDSVMPYLIVLCIEVILAAGYLFWTYWCAMRNMMYANR